MTFLSRLRRFRLFRTWFHSKPSRVNKVPPDEERCIAFTKRDRCKFRRAEGKERCSIHQKMYEKKEAG